jgi:C-terminal processing protease CtpA/Prc
MPATRSAPALDRASRRLAQRHAGPFGRHPTTAGSTFSAGETFIQALMGRTPAPTRIGENTQGVFRRPGPGPAQRLGLGLPNEEFLTRTGRTFDGTGIPPHVKTPVFTPEELTHDRDSAFDHAVALLRH